ncbi:MULTISPECIES: APC family permease [Thioclava]|uniref:Amino acid permease n=1 Tax=Thioclava nitratireducens TaxID=1915078 RepID=A0ABM6IIY0_9RHOB|nr:MULTISPECIES: APC family permease [Thioclava]AQS48787.1 amino acid permease [Thioclava nitratireducens]OWY01466.1 amino acid permease [Thioclava sp. IC9]OWY10159.1 amino acid permease [Thioclava sp. F42-5]OWY17449.1 amino acid permease [Thioclava sp. JM3]
MRDEAHLKRRLGPWLMTGYGVGVMVGAGIYVLVGAVAAQAGIWAPLAFVLAGLIAAPSALSYAELSSRIPEAAGEAAYVEEGLRSHALALIVGLGIVVAGTVSAAAVLRGGAGYLTLLVPLPVEGVMIAFGLALIGVACLGVLESVGLAAALTLVEVVGLALVIWAGLSADPSPDLTPLPAPHWAGIAAAASLAFFAFIGFEDMVNMSEEMRDPIRDMPRAILAALAITAVLYLTVSYAAVRAVPLADLARSEQPLALVWQSAGHAPGILAAIAVAAALNGVLAQVVMAARVLFGLGRRSPALSVFHQAHPRFGTPVLATLLCGVAMIALALAAPVEQLAGITSKVLLGVFLLVNLSLVALKSRSDYAPFKVPMAVPVVGALVAGAALIAALGGFS